MIYSVTRNYIDYLGDSHTRLSCVAHFFTEEEALYHEDNFNVTDTDPGTYYETLVSDTIDKCDFCRLEIAMLIWSE